ncbi:hypothetical protein GCM10022286_17730 [Gryllotalpicola daejeonensis]|uniref:Uncharacterized protein n=1 Tax=Gryllotalpicola daejeonensis TaxID=993087 RepID=A0ABP7ZK04_9MICO
MFHRDDERVPREPGDAQIRRVITAERAPRRHFLGTIRPRLPSRRSHGYPSEAAFPRAPRFVRHAQILPYCRSREADAWFRSGVSGRFARRPIRLLTYATEPDSDLKSARGGCESDRAALSAVSTSLPTARHDAEVREYG